MGSSSRWSVSRAGQVDRQRLSRGLFWGVMALVLCASAGRAAAEEPDLRTRFNQSVELAKAGQYDESIRISLAISHMLPESDRLRVHKLLGFAYRKLGMYPEAWHHLTRYLSEGGEADAAAAGWLAEVEAAMVGSHAKLSLQCDPGDVALEFPPSSSSAQTDAVVCPRHWWLAPGKYRVRAHREGYVPGVIDFAVTGPGEKWGPEIRLVPVAPVAPGGGVLPGEPGTTVSAPLEGGRRAGALEWALYGTGAALGAGGAALHLLAWDRNEDLHDRFKGETGGKAGYDAAYEDEVQPRLTAAWVLYGVGGAVLVSGLVVSLVSGQGETSSERSGSVSVVPLVLPGGTGAGAAATLSW
jgi:hypothetical protein